MKVDIQIPKVIFEISEKIQEGKGRAFLVGGSVRDHFLELPSKDFDIEVFGMDFDVLQATLEAFGKVDRVGSSFGVLKLFREDGIDLDFSIPRIDSKRGMGHKGFEVQGIPSLSFEQAASRRDFTINSMGIKMEDLTLEDPFDGLSDLREGILRHTSNAFGEDPLRVLRAMSFSGRFGMKVAPKTVQICQALDLSELPKERLMLEFEKLLLKSERPSIGLEAARVLGVLRFFPELESLIGVRQDPRWHPEGDVWTHTLMVVDQAAHLRGPDVEENKTLMFSSLCHDLGKPMATQITEDRIRSIGHAQGGIAPTISFLGRLTHSKNWIERVSVLVQHHLTPVQWFHDKERISDGAFLRLKRKLDLKLLSKLTRADQLGRTTPEAILGHFEAGDWFDARIEDLEKSPTQEKPFLTGKLLISMGLPPGPRMGALIRESLELQLDGVISSEEDAIDWAKSRI